MNVTIVRFSESDDLIRVCKGIYYIEQVCFRTPWSENSVDELLHNEFSICIYAEYENRIIGYVGAYRVCDEADITNVAVLPEYRRSGIAKRMMKELSTYCRENNLKKITLEVRESNVAALQLYHGLGYVNVGLRKNYYQNPRENAVLMDLTL